MARGLGGVDALGAIAKSVAGADPTAGAGPDALAAVVAGVVAGSGTGVDASGDLRCAAGVDARASVGPAVIASGIVIVAAMAGTPMVVPLPAAKAMPASRRRARISRALLSHGFIAFFLKRDSVDESEALF
jgi:hypothetical protein